MAGKSELESPSSRLTAESITNYATYQSKLPVMLPTYKNYFFNGGVSENRTPDGWATTSCFTTKLIHQKSSDCTVTAVRYLVRIERTQPRIATMLCIPLN